MHKKLFLALLVVHMCSFPLPAMAVGNLQVSDTFAGIGTSVSLSGFSFNPMDVVVQSPSGAEIVLHTQADAQGNATVNIPGSSVQEAGVYAVTVDQNSQALPANAHFAVRPGAVDAHNSSIETQQMQIGLGHTAGTEIRVTLRDAYANPLSGRPANLITTRATDTATPLTEATDASGMQRFYVESTAPGQTTLSAIDVLSNTVIDTRLTLLVGGMAAIGGDSLMASIIPTAYAQSVITSFDVQSPKVVTVREPFAFSIRAVDTKGNLVPDYNGSVYVSVTNDATAILPGDVNSDRNGFGKLKFLTQSQGQLDVPAALTFSVPGVHEIHVEDANDPSIKGTIKVVVSSDGDTGVSGRIEITSPHNAVNTMQVQVSGKAAPLTNLMVTGGKAPVNTQTDETGKFAAFVDLVDGTKQATLTVTDEQGVLSPATVSFTVDTSAPALQTITFSPPSPEAGANVLAMTQVSDTDLKSIALVIDGKTSMFAQNPSNPTMYQTLFVAPSREDKYSAITTATDDAGNATTLEQTLTVAPKGLSQVQSVHADAQVNGAKISWSAVPENVEGYRIYIGQADDSQTNQEPVFAKTMDTNNDTPSAIVQGLSPGVKYLFAVTALLGNRESTLRSDTVSATPKGIRLQAIPGESDLTLSWDFPDAPSLGAYVVLFGVKPDDLSEQRVINPALQQYRLTDLLPGVLYYVQLVPVTITGEKLIEIAASTQGTPTGTGIFHAAPAEESPINKNDIPPLITLHPGAQNPHVGLPPIAWWTALFLTILGFSFHRKQRKTKKQMRAFARMMNDRYKT